MKHTFMHWKNWPYWVKGGVVGGIMLLLPSILIAVNKKVMWSVILLFCNPAVSTEMSECLVVYAFSSVIALLVEFILGGIVLGHFYGKFKNRKQLST